MCAPRPLPPHPSPPSPPGASLRGLSCPTALPRPLPATLRAFAHLRWHLPPAASRLSLGLTPRPKPTGRLYCPETPGWHTPASGFTPAARSPQAAPESVTPTLGLSPPMLPSSFSRHHRLMTHFSPLTGA